MFFVTWPVLSFPNGQFWNKQYVKDALSRMRHCSWRVNKNHASMSSMQVSSRWFTKPVAVTHGSRVLPRQAFFLQVSVRLKTMA